MKTLVIFCIIFVCVASSPARRSFFDDDDDELAIFRVPVPQAPKDDDPFSFFRVPSVSVPAMPKWSFPSFSFEPFFSMFSMFTMNPLSDPKTQLYNSTVEEKVVDGHVMTVNTSYYVNNETGAVMHVRNVIVKPIQLQPPKEIPATLDTNTPTSTTLDTNTPTSTTQANKDAENEVNGGSDRASEVEDLIA